MKTIELNSKTKILAVNVSSLGDLVSSMALVSAASAKASENKIDFICSDSFRGLLEDEPGLRLISWNDAFAKNYDLILDLTSSGETRREMRKLNGHYKLGRADGLLKRLKANFAYDRTVPKDPHQQLVRNFLPMAAHLGIQMAPFPVLNKISGTEVPLPGSVQKYLQSPKPKFAFHPFSKDRLRTLPLSLVKLAIEAFTARDVAIFLVGSPEEEHQLRQQLREINWASVVYAPLNLRQLKLVLGQSDFFVGADSGPLHVAASLGTPSLGLFGPTLPSLSLPLAPCAIYLDKELPCRPCNTQNPCQFEQRCLQKVGGEDLIHALDRLFAL